MLRQIRPEPTSSEWRSLYERATAFRDQAPWTELTDADLLAVELPTTGEVAYCSLMGAGGIEYGLVAYRGTPGLLAYRLMMSDAMDPDEAMLVQDCLAFTLVDRPYLDDADRAVHANLGLRFRGRGAWPLFRSHRPNLLPLHLGPGEAEFLATCLAQACAVAKEVNAGLLSLDIGDDEVLVRRRDARGCWGTSVASLPRPSLRVEVDGPRLDRIRGRCRRVAQGWEVRLLALARIAEGGGKPAHWGRILLGVEAKSGFVFPSSVLGPGESVQDAFLAAVEGAGVVPDRLRLTSLLLAEQLSPIATAFGIKVERVAKLPSLERASAHLTERFR